MKRSETKSLTSSGAENLLDEFLMRAEALGFAREKTRVPILEWVEGLITSSGVPFTFQGHEYQRDVLDDKSRVIVIRKAAQLGFSEIVTIRCLHGMINGLYPAGVLYLQPSQLDVADYSRARFSPLIIHNPQKIGKYVTQTDAVNIKQIRQSTLYLRGARPTATIENIKKSSSALKSIPIDSLIIDEVDEVSAEMLLLAKERLGHSAVRHETYISTPTVPSFGISELFEKSDQKIWVLKCKSCNKETHLESEFPNCLEKLPDGSVIRICRHCKKEIYPSDGFWLRQYPEREISGYWVSQLISSFVDLKELLNYYLDPPAAGLQEFYNSKLGIPWLPAENRITLQDVYSNCGPDLMGAKSSGPTCAGIDVGATLHIVIAKRTSEKQLEVCYLGRVTDWNALHGICQNFGVEFAVIDAEPETRQARTWAQEEKFPVYLADYHPNPLNAAIWDENNQTIKIGRTETLDWVHEVITTPGRIILPRRNSEVDEFAKQVSSICKILEEDNQGNRTFKYRKTGPDHFAHALGYCLWASTKTRLARDSRRYPRELYAETDFNIFAPNFGLPEN